MPANADSLSTAFNIPVTKAGSGQTHCVDTLAAAKVSRRGDLDHLCVLRRSLGGGGSLDPPRARLYLGCSRRARPLLPFPIAVPGFLGALAAVGTSRRKVNSHQRLTALPAMSLIPRAPLFSFERQFANEREVI